MKGLISITNRYSSEPGPRGNFDYVNIEVIDAESHRKLFDIRVSHEIFGKTITGAGRQACEFDPGDLSKIGMTREHKTVKVEIPLHSIDDKSAEDAVKPYLIDGWVPNMASLFNSRNHSYSEPKGRKRRRYAEVLFERWMPTPPDK